MKFLLEQPEVLSRRAHYDDEFEDNGTTSSPDESKGSHGSPFLGSTAITFLQQYPTEQGCAWKISGRARLGQRDKVLIHRKHEKFRRHQTDSSPRYVQTRFRQCTSREVWAGSMVRRLDAQDALRLAVTTTPVTRTHVGTGCAQNWREREEESISPGSRHVWMQSDRRNRVHQATSVPCRRSGIVHQEKRFGELMRRM